MNCGQAKNLLSAYIDRELGGHAMLALRAHLAECPDCAREATELGDLKTSLNALPMAPVPDGLERRLRLAVHQARTPRRERLVTVGVVAASSVLAAVFAVWYFNATQPATKPVAETAPAFDTQSDQAYVAGSDPFGTHAPILPASFNGQ